MKHRYLIIIIIIHFCISTIKTLSNNEEDRHNIKPSLHNILSSKSIGFKLNESFEMVIIDCSTKIQKVFDCPPVYQLIHRFETYLSKYTDRDINLPWLLFGINLTGKKWEEIKFSFSNVIIEKNNKNNTNIFTLNDSELKTHSIDHDKDYHNWIKKVISILTKSAQSTLLLNDGHDKISYMDLVPKNKNVSVEVLKKYKRTVVFAINEEAGLSDRLSTVQKLMELAYLLQANLSIPRPCYLLTHAHSPGYVVDCNQGWDVYIDPTMSFHGLSNDIPEPLCINPITCCDHVKMNVEMIMAGDFCLILSHSSYEIFHFSEKDTGHFMHGYFKELTSFWTKVPLFHSITTGFNSRVKREAFEIIESHGFKREIPFGILRIRRGDVLFEYPITRKSTDPTLVITVWIEKIIEYQFINFPWLIFGYVEPSYWDNFNNTINDMIINNKNNSNYNNITYNRLINNFLFERDMKFKDKYIDNYYITQMIRFLQYEIAYMDVSTADFLHAVGIDVIGYTNKSHTNHKINYINNNKD